MGIKVESISEKGTKSVNEDSYLVGDSIWGVFDGATSLNKYVDPDGKTGGLIASSLAKECFERNDETLLNMAKKANAAIKNAMEKRGIDISDKLNLWCTNLAVITIIDDKIKWIQLSDAAIVFIYQDGSYKTILGDDHDRETLLKWKKLADDKTENIRESLKEQIKKVRRGINVNYGFLTGEKEMEKFIKEGSEDLKNIKHVVIFTDGFHIPQKSPIDPYPWDDFIKQYLKGGIGMTKKYIRDIEETDSNCWEYPRLKKHDDMTAISIYF